VEAAPGRRGTQDHRSGLDTLVLNQGCQIFLGA
jgi:hypothetical protein